MSRRILPALWQLEHLCAQAASHLALLGITRSWDVDTRDGEAHAEPPRRERRFFCSFCLTHGHAKPRAISWTVARQAQPVQLKKCNSRRLLLVAAKAGSPRILDGSKLDEVQNGRVLHRKSVFPAFGVQKSAGRRVTVAAAIR